MTDPNRGQECPPQVDPPRAGKPLTQVEANKFRDEARQHNGLTLVVDDVELLLDDRDYWRALVERLVEALYPVIDDEKVVDAVAEARRRLEESKG